MFTLDILCHHIEWSVSCKPWHIKENIQYYDINSSETVFKTSKSIRSKILQGLGFVQVLDQTWRKIEFYKNFIYFSYTLSFYRTDFLNLLISFSTKTFEIGKFHWSWDILKNISQTGHTSELLFLVEANQKYTKILKIWKNTLKKIK